MPAKKRSSSKNRSSNSKGRGTRGNGVSGNPQRRAEQLRARVDGPAQPSELAYRMAGGADPAPWWRASHARVIARARAASWPARRAGVEDLTGQIVGGELYDCAREHSTGHHPAQWLVALTGATGTALREALMSGRAALMSGGEALKSSDAVLTSGGAALADDSSWRGLWSLLCGIALTTPKADNDADGPSLLARQYAVKDPYETALAEARQAAALVAGIGADAGTLVSLDLAAADGGGCRLSGPPMVARDSYGSRFLLAAPFTYAAAEEAGWYAWDVDACWIDEVVGAGSFGSAAEALADWRDAVGAAADGAELTECPAELTARLLRKPLEAGPFAEFMRGDEPRELLSEYYRQRRRARDLSASLPGRPPGAFTIDLDEAREEFLRWFTARHGDDAVTDGMAEAVDTITDQWGPHKDIDDLGFHACSPHRIETAARLIRNGHYGEHAGPAILLLPEWTEWCAERSGLGASEAAERARGAARSVAPLADASAAISDHPDSGPFRRRE